MYILFILNVEILNTNRFDKLIILNLSDCVGFNFFITSAREWKVTDSVLVAFIIFYQPVIILRKGYMFHYPL